MDERQTEQGMGVISSQSQAPPAPMPTAMLGGPTQPSLPTLTGTFLGVSMRRAYRLNIKTDEVLVQERAALESQARHITDPDQQAFLAWRRSILLVVAVMFVPLSVSRVFEAFDGPQLSPIGRAFKLLPAITEALFCIVAFDQLKSWTQWRKQRRVLFIAWGLYFLAPFIVYLFPFRSVFDNLGYRQVLEATKVGELQLFTKQNFHMLVGLVFGVEALLALGPKVISLMPGLIRASIVTKLLFPGTTAPGWLMMLAAPFYALFAYIIVLLPYQVTGSWHFVVGNAGLLVAQVFIGISGRRLTVPLSNAEAQHRIHRTWLAYILMLVISAVFMVYGLTDFIRALHLGTWRVVSSVMTIVSNVLLDTLVGTDAIVTAMAFFRRRDVPDPAHAELLAEAERKLDVFCG